MSDMDNAAQVWDGRAEVALGVWIKRYLAEDPPPTDSEIADDLSKWAENLERHGHERLAASGGRHLMAAR